ncbi:SDR family NAD(P)-dependent oxidoreductase [Prauserella alba]|uniref:NAD(P)-dependent dehydrogenase, short-chain alcohol dehydrogenase family n=1 Tax=Prauserella alba TaxID=176898 RepID=A0ABP4FXD1_9PSEU|nr:SDR family oxidoreductase [Prauserella alba]MCP2179239.1 NAD(P)-dependent dehydrogenase, short-chain alcohol dehydrogenase family [Prauserella alba]
MGEPAGHPAPAVVVTGAAQGIGAAIAARFAGAGHPVIGVDLDDDRLHDAVAGWPGRGHVAVTGDAASADDLAAACEQAAATPGGLGTFVANAGHAKAGDSLDYAAEDWDNLLRVHLTGAMVGAQQAAARMPSGGALVLMSSINGMRGFPRRTAYGAAKAGVAGLIRGLAAEWASRGIRVNGIAPGPIKTELSAEFIRRGVIDEREFLARVPMDRFGLPTEVAELAFFLGTPLASYITGTVVPIDGGWSVQGVAC